MRNVKKHGEVSHAARFRTASEPRRRNEFVLDESRLEVFIASAPHSTRDTYSLWSALSCFLFALRFCRLEVRRVPGESKIAGFARNIYGPSSCRRAGPQRWHITRKGDDKTGRNRGGGGRGEREIAEEDNDPPLRPS